MNLRQYVQTIRLLMHLLSTMILLESWPKRRPAVPFSQKYYFYCANKQSRSWLSSLFKCVSLFPFYLLLSSVFLYWWWSEIPCLKNKNKNSCSVKVKHLNQLCQQCWTLIDREHLSMLLLWNCLDDTQLVEVNISTELNVTAEFLCEWINGII